jgi:hypothetical protein
MKTLFDFLAGNASTNYTKKYSEIDDDETESEMEMATEILSMLFLLMIAISCGHFLKRSKHKYLQEAGLTTMIGMVTGFFL